MMKHVHTMAAFHTSFFEQRIIFNHESGSHNDEQKTEVEQSNSLQQPEAVHTIDSATPEVAEQSIKQNVEAAQNTTAEITNKQVSESATVKSNLEAVKTEVNPSTTTEKEQVKQNTPAEKKDMKNFLVM